MSQGMGMGMGGESPFRFPRLDALTLTLILSVEGGGLGPQSLTSPEQKDWASSALAGLAGQQGGSLQVQRLRPQTPELHGSLTLTPTL